MSNLVNFKNSDGLELVIDDTTHEVFASISATARMCDRSKQTISDFVGVRFSELKEAEILTQGGLQGVRLLNEDQILEVVTRYKPELLAAFAKAGLRLYLHHIAGYQVEFQKKPEVVERPKLMPHELALETGRAIAELGEKLNHQPRLASILIDYAMNSVIEANQKVLPQYTEPELRGLVEIAEDMSFKVTHSSRVALGKFVSKVLGNLAVKERRLCNGTNRLINCYPDTMEVREQIRIFFCK